MFHTWQSLRSALTSGSWGCGESGSQKNTSMSISPWAMSAPSCWSPPRGPESSLSTYVSSVSESFAPVVPVAMRVVWLRSFLLWEAHSSSWGFMLSWATSATLRGSASG